MQVEHGPLQHADGSARFSQGATSVLCSVVGPTEVKPRNELLDRAFIEVIVKPAHGLPSTREKLLEEHVRAAVDAVILSSLHPRTTIQIVVQVVQDDGSLLSTAVNAATLALLDAGIALKSVVVAASGGLLHNEEDDDKQTEFVLNLTRTQEDKSTAQFCFAFTSSANSSPEPVMSYCVGSFTGDQLAQAITTLHASAGSTEQLMRQSLEKKFKRQLKK